jgi:hypothetical protein
MTQRSNNQLNVSELDFDQIKTNLKQFLRSQDTLQDYDFEGSAFSTLLDVMAYVTHYNAINANIGINETFIETAQSRGSVVGHARQLSYTPKSSTGAIAYIAIDVIGATSNDLTLQKNHRFRTTVDGVNYGFVTTGSYITDNAFFADVEIKQGILKTVEYIYDLNTAEKFIIPDLNVDTATLTVNVRDSEASSTLYTFTTAKSITTVTNTSRVFFLNETFDGRYEITFGDGVIGQSLVNGNVIEIDYLVCNGVDANGATGFTMLDPIEGNADVTITTTQSATGGAARESIDTIRYRAPLTFSAQNRAVTPDDYRALILENFTNAKSIVVWGGEDNDPPQYGKAFMSIIPLVGETLSNAEESTILNTIIKPKAVVSITPEFVNPTYTYVSLEVFYKKNQAETSLSDGQITSLVNQAISDYDANQLRKFDGVLRYSTLLTAIDTAEKSIINSSVRVYLKKRFIPTLNATVRYELEFSSPIYDTNSNESVIYRSSVFTYAEQQCTFQDYLNSTGDRRIRIVRGSGVNQTIVANDVGYVDALAGKIILTGFNPSAFVGAYIELTVIPNSNDVAPKRNNVVAIDLNDVVILGSGDPIISGSAAAGLNYDLIPRHG